MQIIATSSNGHYDNAATLEHISQRYDKQGRPLMSARRSATSSSKTITRADISRKTSLPSPEDAAQDPRQSGIPRASEGGGLTEASAYAKAVAPNLARPSAANSHTRTKSTDTIIHTRDPSHGARPLPRPPNAPSDSVHSPGKSAHKPELPRNQSQKSLPRGAPPSLSSPNSLGYTRRASAIDFDFPRSPTLPALVDPRNPSPRQAGPRSGASNGSLPALMRPKPSDTLTASLSDVTAKAVNGAELHRPRGKVPIHYLISHPAIQSSLLSAISINAFLSLTGSSEIVRHQFTGESVGRWVLREWGVQTPRHSGIRWPNLTVWEGFCESTRRFVADP